jgi:hypothetical protein
MTAEYARLKGDMDHNILFDACRSLIEEAFDSMRGAKKVRVHLPTRTKLPPSILSLLPHRYNFILKEGFSAIDYRVRKIRLFSRSHQVEAL